METKTYLFGNDGGGTANLVSMLTPLLQQRGIDPNILLAMGNQGYGVGNRMGDRMGNRGNGGNMGSRMWQPNDYDGMGRGRYDGY